MMRTRHLFTFIFVVALFAVAMRETVDPDLWWHLRTGEVILRDGIPREDVFSFTVPDHEWITHEWLAQVVMWKVVETVGLPGLMILFAAITAATYLLLFWASAGRPYLAAFVVFLSAVTSAIVWGARPQMFNLLFTAVFVFLLEKVRRGAIPFRWLWILPPLTALWANFHSGYLLGVVFLGTVAVGEMLQRRLRAPEAALTPAQIRQLFLLTFLSFLAAGLNANGAALWIYPFFTLGSSAMQAYILEWHSPDFQQLVFWPFFVMLALTPLSWLWSGRRPTITTWLLYFGTGAAGLISARNIPLFATILTPTLAQHLTWALEKWPAARDLLAPPTDPLPPRRLRLLNGALALLVLLVGVGWTGQKIAGNEAVIAAGYPIAAVDYLEANGLAAARGYNSYNWGGYLIWRGLPVFVDGRADVYGDPFLDEYRRAFDTQPGWQALLDAYAVDYVLMENGSQLALLLAESADWQLVYDDALAQIFLPSGAANDE